MAHEPQATSRLVSRLSDAGLYHKEIAALVGYDRSVVSRWHAGTRSLTLEIFVGLGRALVRRWPERKLLWAELLLGELARSFGCRLVPIEGDTPAEGQVVLIDAEFQRKLKDAQEVLSVLSGKGG